MHQYSEIAVERSEVYTEVYADPATVTLYVEDGEEGRETTYTVAEATALLVKLGHAISVAQS